MFARPDVGWSFSLAVWTVQLGTTEAKPAKRSHRGSEPESDGNQSKTKYE
jgi:hypothetical protein